MIEVKSVSKKYGNFEAVKNVSFSAGRGQVLGFLGPNGAGKTTIMKMLTGFHFPSAGTVSIGGISVEDDPVEIKKMIGYLPESNPLYGDLSPEEYLDFMASVRLLRGGEKRRAVNEALEICGLEEARGRRIEQLSKGFRQRVGLAQAIIHDPEILILDEPSSGLDPNQIMEIRSLIRELGRRKTVILSTHILPEVEAVCSGVLILNEGRVAAQGTPGEIADALRGVSSGDTWELYLKGAPAAELNLAGLGKEAGEVAVEKAGGGIWRLCFEMSGGGEAYSPEGERIFDWAVSRGYKILGMSRKKISLEDIFVRLTAEAEAPVSMPPGKERTGR